ncbi:MAG: aminopeptidase [Acidimicrobiia bacterium]|nr:aminopeptidase [Acidimicrobiia bacterium]
MRWLIWIAMAAAMWGQGTAKKVYISVDMEGVAGVVTGDQLSPSGFEYARFREFMTDEAVSAVRAAKRAGATEVLVSDSHGNGENLLIEKFPDDVRVIRSWPRRQGMMAGIDGSFAAAVFIAYHSSASNSQGVRAHTISSALLTRVALNGKPVSEGVLNAAIAGHYGVPVIFISGDDAVIAEVRGEIGPVEAVETKKSLGFHAANSLTPVEAQKRIHDGVGAAMAKIGQGKPYRVQTPVTVELDMKHYTAVEMLSYLRVIERPGPHTVRFQARDVLEASDFIQFVTKYSADMQP